MRQVHWHIFLVAVLCAATWAGPSSARAYHTDKIRLLDSTAYSLPRRDLRLGLMKISYGIIDQLQVSTYTMPWLLGLILEEVAPNLELKSTFYDRRRLALSASFGFVEGAYQDALTKTEVRYLLYIAKLASSVRLNSRLRLHIGGQYTATDFVGEAEPADTDLQGAAVVDLLQLWGMFEWRLSRVVALTLTLRWVPWASDVLVRGEVVIDPNTGATVGINVEFVDLTNAYAIIPGFVFSWKRANIRVGVGYGNFFIEGFGLVAPASALHNVSPEFDVFVRF